MSNMVRGVVEAKSNKFGKTSILVNGTWYGSKYGFEANKGDEVEFDNMGGKMVKGLKVISGGGGSYSPSPSAPAVSRSAAPGFPVPVDTKDRAIVRQNSLGHATNLVATMIADLDFKTWEDREVATTKFAELCVDVARIFESYSSGDGDAEEVKKMMEEG